MSTVIYFRLSEVAKAFAFPINSLLASLQRGDSYLSEQDIQARPHTSRKVCFRTAMQFGIVGSMTSHIRKGIPGDHWKRAGEILEIAASETEISLDAFLRDDVKPLIAVVPAANEPPSVVDCAALECKLHEIPYENFIAINLSRLAEKLSRVKSMRRRESPVRDEISVNSAVACRIADFNPGHLNELICRGIYTGAPATIAGRARNFNHDDLIQLWIFAGLIREGYNARRANKIACKISATSRKAPCRVLHLVSFADDPGGAWVTPALTPSQRDTLVVRTVPIARIRKIIARRLGLERDTLSDEIT